MMVIFTKHLYSCNPFFLFFFFSFFFQIYISFTPNISPSYLPFYQPDVELELILVYRIHHTGDYVSLCKLLQYTSGIYSVVIGIGIISLWTMLLIKGEVVELETEPIRMILHLCAEFVMAILSLVSGIAILFDKTWGSLLFVLSTGFVLYIAIVSSGYYAQLNNWGFVIMFIVIAIISTTIVSLIIHRLYWTILQ